MKSQNSQRVHRFGDGGLFGSAGVRCYAIYTCQCDVEREQEDDDEREVPSDEYGQRDDQVLAAPVAVLVQQEDGQREDEQKLDQHRTDRHRAAPRRARPTITGAGRQKTTSRS